MQTEQPSTTAHTAAYQQPQPLHAHDPAARRRATLAVVLGSTALLLSSAMLFNSVFGPIRITVGDPAPAVAALAALPTTAPVAAPVPAAPQAALPAATALATDPANSVRVVTVGNAAYALDTLTGTYFAFDANMQPVPMDRAQLPAEAVAQLALPQAPAVVGNTDQQFAQAQAQSAAIAEGNDLAINAMLADKEIAASILQLLDRAAGVDADGVRGMGNLPVYVFFDAQCPYCHQLYVDMDGKVDSKWLPTLALGDGGIPLITHIMGEGNVELIAGADGNTESVNVKEDPAMAERLRAVVGGGDRPTMEGTISPEIEFVSNENMTLMRYLFGRQTHLVGVPAIIVGLPDGTAKMLRGYEATTVGEILSLQGRG
ncbi:hypothetical protein [Pseudogemmobacter faecipullorum]|uniref:Thioredoxin-like fold domain-containing protein n=1 Tax=Pseudogemmobacter faecipullorum TaxID=2755041 RepID=A0ABS8CQR1_9RHOB|nr:hypothetical protein [Pseudogemmobacter faecipullorum]MCB5411737.1 hypothetical protein [Pseudogemmobacter faecipullorum]